MEYLGSNRKCCLRSATSESLLKHKKSNKFWYGPQNCENLNFSSLFQTLLKYGICFGIAADKARENSNCRNFEVYIIVC